MSNNKEIDVKAALITIVILLILVLPYSIIYRLSAETTTFVVSEKFIKRNGDSDRYFVSTTDGSVLVNKDAWEFFKWDSSDIYAKLKVGHKYRAQTAGWRVRFFSMYENIISLEDLGEDVSIPVDKPQSN